MIQQLIHISYGFIDFTQESVGPNNIPGYGKVQELAACLVILRKNTYLTDQEADRLIQLWNNLIDYDKRPTSFPERFSKEARGRYKAKKSIPNVVPGVESTER
ncbi:hypothetical protein DPMN_078709 [Dreissena polymorpha]|uniref:Uncharacterized protein n=1 Tax=Dreissena polymorpha TaxID=45954 RepID=A0A9D4BSD5_DREPO|nr:hypothetical protein DPMN_078709 [Dreissena polymorpha]